MKKPALSRRLLFAIFTLSGFSGLIYESIWSHYLKLFLGHAAYAQTLVLAIFMGGMALGAWLVSRNTTRIKNLLVGYALVELLTGVLALLFHRVYTGAIGFAFDTAIPSLDSVATISMFKWTLAALLILPQSILLGTTFPLISSGVIRRFPENSGETLAMLYFTNSLGAALGVLASGFWFIGAVGLPGTVMAAGILNILLALFVWVMARDEDVAAKPVPAPSSATSVVARAILLAAFLAGMASFIYEIAWIRMLSLVLGSSTHAFELMLSAFILGLALGGYWVKKRIAGYTNPQRTLAIMFALMAILGAMTLPAYGYYFDFMSGIMRTFAATGPGYAGFNIISHLIAAATMIPTTVIAGMTLPLMTHYLLREGAGEQAIGKVYAANTVGAIVGVLAAIHLMLPNIGTKGAVITAALVQGVIALMLLFREAPAARTRFALGTLAASAVAILAIGLLVRLDPMKMASGVYRHGFATLPKDMKMLYYRDGKTATISLARQEDKVVISTNGKPDAALNVGNSAVQPDEITMTMAGALPILLQPEARRIANIGIGSGLTSHVVLASKNVEVLDSIEIERAVYEAARIGFHGRVRRMFDDPRSKVYFEDAKTFFATTKQPYDVIISEPSNQWVSGVASLFSNEFYTQIKRYITPNGLLIQWVQTYETDVSVIASIVKAMSPHFNDYQIFLTDDSDILIVASPQGTIPGLRADVLTGTLAEELRIVAVDSIADLELRRIGTKRLLDPLFATYPVPANSDYFPFVDLTAPKMRFLKRDAIALAELNRLPVPVMELLGDPGMLPDAGKSNREFFLAKQTLAREARNIRDAILNGEIDRMPASSAMQVLAIATPKDRCSQPGVPQTWFQAVKSLADTTSSMLPPQELQPMWEKLRTSTCLEHLSDLQKNWIAYLEAVALRNRAEVARLGNFLLTELKTLPPDDRISIILGTTASQLALGESEAAFKLLEQDFPLVMESRDRNLGVRVVEALAVAQQRARTAGAATAAN